MNGVPYSSSSHSQVPTYGRLGLSRGHPAADLLDLLLREDGTGDPSAFGLVAHIVGVGSDFQVGRVTARRVIAPMADLERSWVLAGGQ